MTNIIHNKSTHWNCTEISFLPIKWRSKKVINGAAEEYRHCTHTQRRYREKIYTFYRGQLGNIKIINAQGFWSSNSFSRFILRIYPTCVQRLYLHQYLCSYPYPTFYLSIIYLSIYPSTFNRKILKDVGEPVFRKSNE